MFYCTFSVNFKVIRKQRQHNRDGFELHLFVIIGHQLLQKQTEHRYLQVIIFYLNLIGSL